MEDDQMDHLDRSQAHGEALEQQMNVLRVAPHTVERSLRWWRDIACMGLLVTLAMMAHPPSAPARIEVRSGPGLRYEVMAEVPSGGSYVVVAQEQEWYKIQLPDGREGWVHRFYMGQPPSAPEQPPSQTAPVVTPPPAMPSSAVATPAVTPSLVVPTGPINSAPPERSMLGSVFDYLYRAGTEKPQYGLYSYVLFPIYKQRVKHFLQELFKTTSFVELINISFENLNIIYLPTRADRQSSLIPIVADGSAPSVIPFALQFYDYALAQKILAQICTAPTEAIRTVCGTDLTRGPYLFTFRYPASALSPVPPPYLFVDLSNVHERAFGEFITAYKEQVKRTDYTDLERIDNLRLSLLNIVLTSADWIGPIKGTIENILHLNTSE
jgi:hypothetical protein